MKKTILQAFRPLVLTLVFSSISVFSACTSATADNPVTKDDDHVRKALLIVLDGWGIGDKSKGDVIYQTPTPYIDYLNANYPHAELQASGGYVGLPDGQMGNSETGHLNIGAGRIVYQDLVKINRACADKDRHNSLIARFGYKNTCISRMNLYLSLPSMLQTK